MNDRFIVFGRILDRRPVYHVYDRTARSEVLGRWERREDAQAHADACNAREREG